MGLEEGLDFFFESSSGSFFVRVALLLVTILLAVDKWFSSPAAYFFPKIPLNFFSCFVEVTVFSLSTSFFSHCLLMLALVHPLCLYSFKDHC